MFWGVLAEKAFKLKAFRPAGFPCPRKPGAKRRLPHPHQPSNARATEFRLGHEPVQGPIQDLVFAPARVSRSPKIRIHLGTMTFASQGRLHIFYQVLYLF